VKLRDHLPALPVPDANALVIPRTGYQAAVRTYANGHAHIGVSAHFFQEAAVIDIPEQEGLVHG